MRFARLLLSTISWLFPAQIILAASYPAGNATQSFDFSDGIVDLGDGSVIGSDAKTGTGAPVAGVYGGALRLTDNAMLNAIGSFKLPDLDPGNVIKSFDLKFTVVMDSQSAASPSEGWSVNFGRIPNDNGTGEGGFAPLQGGLTIAFDTFDNGNDPPSIEVFIGDVSLKDVPWSFVFDAASRAVAIHWDSFGLDVTYEGKVMCADLPTPGFAPGVGHVFAFTARTTSAGMNVSIDNLRATTQALPVIETGGPIISEFVANNSEFEDEFADKSGWIELFNGSAASADLTGWYLTDSKDNLAKWKIPSLTLSPYNYQVVFASGRSRSLSATSFLHAGFTLGKNGGYLALVRPDGKSIASAYEYGPQEKNVAYGEKGAERSRGYMYPASPGTVNTQDPAPASLSPEVEFSHPGGFISAPLTLMLAAPSSPGAKIHYTLDRTEPGPASAVFTNPIPINLFTTVKARVYASGHLLGRTSSRTFVMMDATLTNYAGTGKVFDSNLPLIFLDSFGVNVDGSTGGSRPFRPSYAMVIQPDPKSRRASLMTPPEYAGPAGVHVRGESSAGFDQRSYSLELWDDAAKDRDAGLLGMPADSDWALIGPWSEKTLMRNKLVFDWMIALRGEDGTSVRSRFVELFFNQTRPASGQVGYSSYRGIYLLTEKLKRGKDRVPIENLNDKTIDPELITGGYIIRKDKDDTLKSNWTTARFGIPLQSFDPDRLNAPQLGYIRNYVNAFETALNGTNFRNLTNGYRAYIDTDTFIDAQWLLEISKQVDGYVFSTYFHKDRAGRLRAGPLWDFNISLGNADYATGDRATGWLYDNANGVGQLWYPRLHADPDYKLAHWDRYWQMRRTILANEAVLRTIDGHMATLLDGYTGAVSNRAPAEIQNPVARHFRKWPRLGSRDWPNPPAETKIRTWQAEVDYMKNWIIPRLEWLDDQSMRIGRVVYRPPVLSHEGGPISTATRLTLEPYRRESPANQYAEGEIYFTLDNSDPRLPGGEISILAHKYSAPLMIESSVTVNARLYLNRQWSPLAFATFLYNAVPASAANLVVSEIMYRPAPPTPSEITAGLLDAGAFEFLELRSIAKQAVDLSGVKFVSGIDFDFGFVPPSVRLLKPGESVVLVADKRAFSIRYPQVPNWKIAGQFRGRLDNGGETLSIQAADGSVLQDFRYDDDAPWPAVGDGGGRSLVLKEPATNPKPADPPRWIVSVRTGGTPGESGSGSDVFAGDPVKDTDGDGLTDLFEFATGSDPENPGSGFPPAASITPIEVNGVTADYLTLSFRRRPTARGVAFALELSKDLRTWGSADSTLTLIGSRPNQDGTVTESFRSTSAFPNGSSPSMFFRLKVQPQ
ncbi:MAG: CotH kinase family protein [Verrucomicrobia bacterium]|nr:CotH kinase family protein [Verrucomicrobiota bacterium]